jgi:hypothetical protein
MLLLTAQRSADKVLNENLVTAASIALIAASILWVVLSRLTLRNLRKAAGTPLTRAKNQRDKSRDLWKEPPEAGH